MRTLTILWLLSTAFGLATLDQPHHTASGTSLSSSLFRSFRPIYAGRHSGGGAPGIAFSIELSSDSSEVIEIIVSSLVCSPSGNFHTHTFTLSPNPGWAVVDDRFSANDISVEIPSAGHGHMLDIDGVIFDADGDGTKEQALGGLSFLTEATRCNFRWWATAVATDNDGDGWSDSAERRLGSDQHLATPEHYLVPTTTLYGPGPCNDFEDNDGDGQIDGNEEDGPDTDSCSDCIGSLPAPSGLRAEINSDSLITLTWRDNSDHETGFEIMRGFDNLLFESIAIVAPNETSYVDTYVDGAELLYYRIRAIDGSSGVCTVSNDISTVVPVYIESLAGVVPSVFEFGQNYPNPFSFGTTIEFSLPHPDHIRLKVFDIQGREIITLVDQHFSSGKYKVHWDASGLRSGVYFYRIETSRFADIKQLVLLK